MRSSTAGGIRKNCSYDCLGVAPLHQSGFINHENYLEKSMKMRNKSLTKQLVTIVFALVAFSMQGVVSAGKIDCSAFTKLADQDYALCAGALTWNFDGITYAKCKKMHGNSLSLTQPYPAPPKPQQGDIQTINDIGTAPDNGAFIVSTYSPPEGARSPSGDLAVYNCKRKGSYAQCDGGICFTNTSGKNFPGLGKLAENEIMCSCPITTANVYEVFGPNPCPKTAAEFDQVCATGSRSAKNGEYLRIGSPGRGNIQIFSDCLEPKPEPVYLNRCVRPSR